MCELVIRVKDAIMTGDPVFDSKVTRRGDVIQVFEDGFIAATCGHEGSMVRTHDFWRILLLPNVSYNVGVMLESPEPQMDPTHQATHSRAYYFDLEHSIFSPELRSYIEDDTRAQPFFEDKSINDENIGALFSRKPSIINPGHL